MVLPSFLPPLSCSLELRVGKRRRTQRGNVLRLIQDPFSDVEFCENFVRLSRQFTPSPNRRFEFHKRGQLFISTHHETLSVIAVCINNPAHGGVGFWLPLLCTGASKAEKS